MTIMNLLHSFSDADLALPETYETLIAYLDNEALAIRGLAYWHLYRLVPVGQKIGYNPLAPKEERKQAINQWQKLIRKGKLSCLYWAGSDVPRHSGQQAGAGTSRLDRSKRTIGLWG